MATLNEVSSAGGVQLVTIPSPAASTAATNQRCRKCWIQHKSGTATYMNVDGTASASSYLLPKANAATGAEAPIAYEIENLNHLSFFGTAGDIVQILFRK